VKAESSLDKIAAIKKAMAATYVEVSLDDVEKLIKRSFHATRPKRGDRGGIYYYDLKVGENVAIRVWTSVSVRSERGRDVGDSAIRVQLVSTKGKGRPLQTGKSPIVKRTQNWRTNLQDLIEETLELYEEKEQYWESLAGGTRAPAVSDEEANAKDEDGEGADGGGDQDEGSEPPDEPRVLDETASWARCSDGNWGVAVVDPKAKEGDKVRTRNQAGDESTVTLAEFDRVSYGKRIFYKGKQEGGRPQRSTYDRRRF